MNFFKTHLYTPAAIEVLSHMVQHILSRFSRVLDVLKKKFDWTVIQYPSEDDDWKLLLKESNIPQILFFISEDRNLYVVDIDPKHSLDNLKFS